MSSSISPISQDAHTFQFVSSQPHQITEKTTIKCALSDAWIDKSIKSGFTEAEAYSLSFNSAPFTLEAIADHILTGGKFTSVSFSKKQRKADYFESSQMIVLDFDAGVSVQELMKIAFVKEYAWLCYPTPSSTQENLRTRLVFVLDQPISDAKQWTWLAKGLYNHFKTQLAHIPELNIDPASFRASQPWAGSTNRVEQPYINHAARLPIALIPDPPMAHKTTPIVVSQSEISSNVIDAIVQKLGIQRFNADGWSKHLPCLFKQHEHDDVRPASAWHREKHIFHCNKCQKTWLAKDVAEMLGIEWPRKPKHSVKKRIQKQAQSEKPNSGHPLTEPAKLPPFRAQRSFNSRYVSNAPSETFNAKCIALKSPTGSGKSQWAAKHTANAPSLLVVSFRQTLAYSQADLYKATAYNDLTGGILPSSNRISTTIDSVHKFSNRIFNTIVIDEWVSLLGHFSSAGTLREKAPQSLHLLKQLIAKAQRVIVMDAHLTNDSLTELNLLRDDVVCIENTFVQTKAPTQILSMPHDFYTTILTRIEIATLPVLIGVTSTQEARLTKDLIEYYFPGKRINVITRNQSHLKTTRTFIKHINKHLAEYDAVIFNGAMSTGVSVDLLVDSIICMINRPLSPADGVQMLGRARNVPLRYARVPKGIDGLDCNAVEIYEHLDYATRLSHVDATKPARALARLRARHEAQRNTEMSHFMPYFRAYCHADGSDTIKTEVPFNKNVARTIKQFRDLYTVNKRQDTLNTTAIPTITPEALDEIREKGMQEITTEIDAGYLRYKIENAVAHPINEALYDRYHTDKSREAIYRLDNSTARNTHQIDVFENTNNVPLHQRRFALASKKLFAQGLQVLGVTKLSELSSVIDGKPAEYFDEFRRWAAQNKARFESILKYRSDHDGDLNDGVKSLRFFLKRYGIALHRKQVMRNKKRFMTYMVDANHVAELISIIERRRQKAVAEREKKITTKRQKFQSLLPFRSNDRVPTNNNIQLPLLPTTRRPVNQFINSSTYP